MSGWRVVEMRDQDGMPYYVLEDVEQRLGFPDTGPFFTVLHHRPTPLLAQDADGLRAVLRSMAEAFDRPVLRYRPARLEERV
jgi:hypothetical protein